MCVDFDIALQINPLPALSQHSSSQDAMGRLFCENIVVERRDRM